MNLRLAHACALLFTLLTQACSSHGAQGSLCLDAERVTREAMALMAATARDESTKLRGLVRDGWQTPYDDLTIIRSVRVDGCRAQGESAEVVVLFDVVGRLVAAGQGDRVAFETAPRLERREVRAVAVDGVTKLDDVSWLEPHVRAEYAISILEEIANGQPRFKPKSLVLIDELRRVGGRDSKALPDR